MSAAEEGFLGGTPMSIAALDRRELQSERTPIDVTWAGNPWRLTGLCFLNLLLIVITVGIYWFWARAEYRRYMWQMVRVNGEPLEYTGTGKELFIGYLKLFLFVILPAILIIAGAQLALGQQNPAIAIVILIFYAGFFYLYFVGVYRAHRYILSRTRWRGIAFGLGGYASGYAWTSIWTAIVGGLTLGWLLPWRTVALRRRIVSAMHFGSAPLRYEGRAGPLYVPFIFAWFVSAAIMGAYLAIIISIAPNMQLGQEANIRYSDLPHLAIWIIAAAIPLGIVAGSWFEARKLNLYARATKFGGAGAHLEASAGSILWLTVSNFLILTLTLGILRPVTQARRLKYIVTRLSFSGSADLDEVLRGAELEGSQGAGLETAFSIEIF